MNVAIGWLIDLGRLTLPLGFSLSPVLELPFICNLVWSWPASFWCRLFFVDHFGKLFGEVNNENNGIYIVIVRYPAGPCGFMFG